MFSPWHSYKRPCASCSLPVPNDEAYLRRNILSFKILNSTCGNKFYSRLSFNIPEIRTQQMCFLKKIHKNYKDQSSPAQVDQQRSYLDICAVLSTHLDDIPNLIRNSQDAIARLANIDLSREKDVILVSLDVVNLYMSIPQGDWH